MKSFFMASSTSCLADLYVFHFKLFLPWALSCLTLTHGLLPRALPLKRLPTLL